MKPVLFALASFFLVCLLSFTNSTPGNFLSVGDKTYSLPFSQLANESYNTKSKFEVDLIHDNKDLAKAKTYIYFSLTGDNTTALTNGIYQFSSEALDKRLPFQFSGATKINDHKVDISSGTVSIENQNQEYIIHFIVKLQNGDVVKGIYRGSILALDRKRTYQ